MVRTQRVPNTKNIPTGKADSKRESAVAMAEAGFTVISLPPGQKAPPSESGWQNWPPSDPKAVENQWTKPDNNSTDRNIGVTTGRRFIVLDFDRKKRGCESYSRLTVLEDRLPATFTVRTQDGGYHVYFLCDERLASGTDVLDHVGLPGVDLRATPGYVVAPGSDVLCEDKDDEDFGKLRPYVALNSLPMAPAPRWLLNALGERKVGVKAKNREIPAVELDTEDNMRAVVDYLENDAPEAIQGSGGDTTTFAVACWVRDLGVSEPVALDLMLDHWNEQKAKPTWTPEDLAVKVYNAFNHSQNQHGSKAAALPQNEFPKLPDSIIAAIAAQTPPKLLAGHSGQKPAISSSDSREKPKILLERRSEVVSPEVEWLVDRLLPQECVAILYGAGGTFKSFFALHLSDMIAAKRNFLGHKTLTPTNRPDIIYLAAEGGAGLRKRLDAAEVIHGVAPDNVVFLRQALNLRSNRDDADALIAAIKEGGHRPCLVIVDTLAQSFGGGNENASEDMGAFQGTMQYMREKIGATVLAIHHSGKDTAKGPRGHTSLPYNIDTSIELNLVKAAPGEGGGAGFGTFFVKKQKDGAVDWGHGFAVQRVPLDINETSSLAVRELSEGESTMLVEVKEVKLSVAAHQALDILHSQIENGDGKGRSDVWRRGVISREICSEADWPAIRKELKDMKAFVSLGGKQIAVGIGFHAFGFGTGESTLNPQCEDS